jgi:hypothetical protein
MGFLGLAMPDGARGLLSVAGQPGIDVSACSRADDPLVWILDDVIQKLDGCNPRNVVFAGAELLCSSGGDGGLASAGSAEAFVNHLERSEH